MPDRLWAAFEAGRKPVIGMLHVPALPGSPQNTLGFDSIVKWVMQDAAALRDGGIDAVILENFGDVPFFPERVPSDTLAFMTVLARDVRVHLHLPLGINVLRNDAESALAIAAAVGAEFIRVNVYTGARLTDQGLIQGMAHRLLRYRKSLGSNVKILADVDVKHSAPLAERELSDEVEETVSRGCADGIIVTGAATGRQTALEDLKRAAAAAAGTPVLAGSGVNAANAKTVLEVADGLIVGTAFKRDRVTTNPVDSECVRKFMRAVRRPPDQQAQGAGWLAAQKRTPADLERILATVSTEQLTSRPGTDRWSIAEIIAHLAEDEIATAWRYRQMVEHSGIELSGFDQDLWARLGVYRSRLPQESLTLFRLLRDANIRFLQQLAPEQWECFGVHAERGRMTIRDLAAHMAGHDARHMEQIRTILG